MVVFYMFWLSKDRPKVRILRGEMESTQGKRKMCGKGTKVGGNRLTCDPEN